MIGVLASGVSVGKASVYYSKYLILVFLTFFISTVNTGEKGFKFNKVSGVRDRTFKEGYHLKAPWFEKEIIYNVKS